jgi:hypothetical protein
LPSTPLRCRGGRTRHGARYRIAWWLSRKDCAAAMGHRWHGVLLGVGRSRANGSSPVYVFRTTLIVNGAGRFEWVRDWDAQWLPVARDEPDMSIFDTVERQLIDRVVDRYRNTSGRQLVELAHDFPGWIHAWRGGGWPGGTRAVRVDLLGASH